MMVSTPSHAFELFGKKYFESESEDTTVADPVRYSVVFSSEGLSADEESDIRSASELIAGEDAPVSGSLGLLVKAKADRDILIGALYEQARYSGLVQIFVEGKELRSIPATAEFETAGPVPIEIRVTAGKLFRFGEVSLSGDVENRSVDEFGIVSGEPAKSNLIIAGQDRLLSELKHYGHPYARLGNSDVVADHDTATLDVTLNVIAGPLATIGDVSVMGNETVDTDLIISQASSVTGQQYSPERIAEIRKRLLELGVFGTVTIEEGESLNERGEVPLIIEVTERKHRYFGVGATYSNEQGGGVEGYWGHRNLFGGAERLRIEGSISRIGETQSLEGLNYSAAILFEKPSFYDPSATFSADLRAVSENYDAFERRSVKGDIKYRRVLDDRQSISAGASLDVSRIDEGGVESRHLILSAPLEYALDNSDDQFNPTAGSRLLLQVEPAHDFESGASFAKGKAVVSAYHSVSPDTVLAGRAALGSIYGASLANVPADRRFYAGGGGSVRGYAYQSIGPRDVNGRVTGGLSLFEGSVEARIKINESFAVVPFLDMGTVSGSRFPDFSDMRYGAGAGIRYQTPFGPLRVDVGVPLDRQPGEDSWGVYAGIGQTF